MTDHLSFLPSEISPQELAYIRFRESERFGNDRRVLVVAADGIKVKITGFENGCRVFEETDLYEVYFKPEFIIVYGSAPQIRNTYRTLKSHYPDATVLHDHDPNKTISFGKDTLLRLAEGYREHLRELKADIERSLSSEEIRITIQREFDKAISDMFAPTYRHVYDKFIEGKIGDSTTEDLINCLSATTSRLLSDTYPEQSKQIAERVCPAVASSIHRSISSMLGTLGETMPADIIPVPKFDVPEKGLSNPWLEFPMRQLTTDIFGTSHLIGNIFKTRTRDERIIFADAVRIKAHQLQYSWPLQDMVPAVSVTRNTIKAVLPQIFNGLQFRAFPDDSTPQPLCNHDPDRLHQ